MNKMIFNPLLFLSEVHDNVDHVAYSANHNYAVHIFLPKKSDKNFQL